jgi:hypothetical protein
MALKTLPLLLAPLVLAGAIASGTDRSAERMQCIATLTPDSVLRGADPVNVTYGLSEPIGSVSRVMPDQGSGIIVTAVDSAQSLLTLDTNAAEAGSWNLTFHGSEERTCGGTIYVRGMEHGR